MFELHDTYRQPAAAARPLPRAALVLAATLAALAWVAVAGPASAQTPYVGEVRSAGFNFAPNGWIPCDGQLLPISQYDVLFVLIGTTYGGDGEQTFAVPDLRGRVPVEAGAGPGLQNYVMGEIFGLENVTLTVNQLPPHTHVALADSGEGAADSPAGALHARDASGVPHYGSNPSVSLAPSAVSTVGGGQPHPNQPPYLVVNYFISPFGIFPSQNKPGVTGESKPVIVKPGQTLASLKGLIDVPEWAKKSAGVK